MNNTYTLKIAGRELRIITDEEPAYVEELCERLNGIIDGTVAECGASRMDAALLCALDTLDRALKAEGQLRQVRADNTRLLEQLSRVKKHGR